jgi:hypothetical protein
MAAPISKGATNLAGTWNLVRKVFDEIGKHQVDYRNRTGNYRMTLTKSLKWYGDDINDIILL